ncbi:16S rRNA (uracil(1498)-N(3))-methyltransferase [Rhodobaculum claviforme]|uniref:Ribosomal RNA small subunit methyltransferase E n=1 Tax=Rhodobaculum claviforme TaxID=1549854 RepID=A0A934TL63_9RHOB|nr:16S rRNA (uracil(1498)-N(3))-methyltransferase [Rhodobaculum claviforme]MBK5928175.1 16S rRNA (uracil(1498)-N(3))-methyltransferase [Rhodobaculum claviforme]
MSRSAKIRLFVDAPLGAGQCVGLTGPQAHYLFAVMRLAEGARVALFNGRDGEWQAEVTTVHRNRGEVRCTQASAALSLPPDLWLLFAPLKKTRTDFIVEKATELGVRRILPVGTDFTNAERLRRDRLQAHAVEAAEQCGATFVPEVADLTPLRRALEGWDPARRILWCDEGLAGFVPEGADAPPAAAQEGQAPAIPDGPALGAPDGPGPWAILIGPEGGFSPPERARIAALPFVHPVRLGPRILRADTAAVAALTWWQITHGDWSAP